jgi:hypothetical protein
MPRDKPFSDYGPTMQKFMDRARHEGVPPDAPIATRIIRDGCTRAQLLEAAGLVEIRQSKKGRPLWKLTDVGLGLHMEHRPVFLHRRGFPSYTSKPWQAMTNEPEVIRDAA